jgi:hypothetical protein
MPVTPCPGCTHENPAGQKFVLGGCDTRDLRAAKVLLDARASG